MTATALFFTVMGRDIRLALRRPSDALYALFFFVVTATLFPLATSGAMEPFPFLAGTAGALVGGLQNMGSGVLAGFSALLPQTSQSSIGMLMTAMGVLVLFCWLPLALREQQHRQPI